MPDLTAALVARLQADRLPGLDLGGDFILPAYDGYSLLNLPAAICNTLGVPPLVGEPLAEPVSANLPDGARRVVLLVLDGLGLQMLQRYLAERQGGVWARLAAQGTLAALTSICPSTTASALTTLWTGVGAASHGITGYEMWLKEYGLVANMISHAPMSFGADPGSLRRAGFVPETFLPVPTLGPHLRRYGVEPYAFMHQAIARSGLSAMHLPECAVTAFRSPADLWISLRHLVEQGGDQRQYVYAYWGDLDDLAHRFGPDDERVAAEFDAFSSTFERVFLDRLPDAARGETLLLLTADHGMIHTPKDPVYHLQNHPRLLNWLHIMPTGENRLAYLHIRPGCARQVERYIEQTWRGQFALVETRQALEAGLFGGGTRHAGIADRLGELMVVARDGAYLWWAPKENPFVGRHGGLTPAEMLVPLLAARI